MFNQKYVVTLYQAHSGQLHVGPMRGKTMPKVIFWLDQNVMSLIEKGKYKLRKGPVQCDMFISAYDFIDMESFSAQKEGDKAS